MAREYAQVRLRIWNDDDFLDLSPAAQHLYLVLLTSPELSHAGVTDWRPNRIARKAKGWDVEMVEAAAEELVEHLYLVVDEDTEEVLIRSYVRHDGILKQPKMSAAMATAHAAIASRNIRGVVIHELQRLHREAPEAKGWGVDQALDLLNRKAIDPSTYPCRKGSVKGSSEGLARGSGKPSGTPNPKGSGEGSASPVPRDVPITYNQNPTASLRSAGDAAASPAAGGPDGFDSLIDFPADPPEDPPPIEATTRTLLGEWIETCGKGKRPPKQVIDRAGKEIKAMLAEGIPAHDIRAGIIAWHGKGLGPPALPGVVHELRTADQRTATVRNLPSPQPSARDRALNPHLYRSGS